MEKIQSYTVTVVLDENSELMRRIQASADARGIPLEAALEDLVNIGLWPHINRNLDLLERLSKEAIA